MRPTESNDIPPCQIYIDKEGKWFHKGKEMIHREFIRLFYENMEMDARGRTIIRWDGNPCVVDVEDTAFVVQRVDHREGTLLVSLSDDTVEELAPETLRVGEGNVLYCDVKNRTFPARFTRPAYYQLAEHVQEENGSFYVTAGGNRYPIDV